MTSQGSAGPDGSGPADLAGPPGELQAVSRLQSLLQELYDIAPPLEAIEPEAKRAPSRSPSPSVGQVVSGLGYLVALQKSPEVAAALTAGMSSSVLESLQSVLQRWLVEHALEGAQRQPPGDPARFYQRASEHLRRLGLPGSGKGEGDKP